jgi:hypothetical protein
VPDSSRTRATYTGGTGTVMASGGCSPLSSPILQGKGLLTSRPPTRDEVTERPAEVSYADAGRERGEG